MQPCISFQAWQLESKGKFSCCKKCDNVYFYKKPCVLLLFPVRGFSLLSPPPFFFLSFFIFYFFFSDIGFFFSCSSKAISLCLWTGNLFPWKWMGCHKHSAMTSLQAQGEDGSKRGISDYFRLLWLPTVNPNGQIMERRERVGLNRDIGVTWVGDEGCDDYSLWDVSFCERKAIDLLLFVS